MKLLRQMETLQTQYALATENWQGIESSLLSRITNLEKERDEIERKDFDVRRKAREAVSVLANCKCHLLRTSRVRNIADLRKIFINR